MPLQITSAAPAADSFVPVESHQSETPSTFFSETPVLHFHDKDASIVVSKSQLASLPLFPASADAGEPKQNGEHENQEDAQVSIPNIGVWITSKFVELFNPAVSKGVKIPYLSISLHAIQTITPPGAAEPCKAIYMQLSLSTLGDADPNAADEGAYDDEDVLELSLIPSQPSAEDSSASKDAVEELFNALSVCSNLNPDEPNSDDEEPGIYTEGDYEADGDEDGGLPPPFPGSGGWITSENVDESFDADGNWTGPGNPPAAANIQVQTSLGEGAGTVREREEDEVDGGSTEDTKWRRTE